MIRQRTIREKVVCEGVGLHCGRPIKLELLPAPVDSQIIFVRTDVAAHPELRAHVENLADTTLATSLATGLNGSRVQIGTVEHLLAALAGLGIDNVRVLCHGPEIPIMDGSAAPWVDLLTTAGVEEQRKSRRFIVIKREVKVTDGEKMARIAPGPGLQLTCALDFDHPLISPTPFRLELSESAFRREVAKARTFGFLNDVEALRARGLARGGSLANSIVIDHYRVLNPEGLRYPDEFVRHKTLDAIGDLSLFGMPVIGRVHLKRSGHALNTRLVKTVLSDARNFEIVESRGQELSAAGEVGESNPFAAFEPVESVA
jgi:UDP-3-O-[3-hydroxymyristoyl] N-acetylglucosamine deacetylase